MTLDVRVWEPSVIGYFQSVGNTYANTIWEELLALDSKDTEDLDDRCACNHFGHFILFLYFLLVNEIYGDLLLFCWACPAEVLVMAEMDPPETLQE